MIGEMYYKLKSLVRPVTQHRRLLERAKYLGTRILSAQEGNDYLARSIPQTAAIGKIGSSEMAALRHYWRRADSRGHCKSWGWEGKNLYRIAGVYPPEPAIFSRFCRAYAEALTNFDVLAVWFNFGENAARKRFRTLLSRAAVEPASGGETRIGCKSFHRHDSFSIATSARGVEQEARRASGFRAAHAAISAKCFLDHASVSRLVHRARRDARANGFHPV